MGSCFFSVFLFGLRALSFHGIWYCVCFSRTRARDPISETPNHKLRALPTGSIFKVQILYEFVIRVGRRRFRNSRWSSLLLLLLMLL